MDCAKQRYTSAKRRSIWSRIFPITPETLRFPEISVVSTDIYGRKWFLSAFCRRTAMKKRCSSRFGRLPKTAGTLRVEGGAACPGILVLHRGRASQGSQQLECPRMQFRISAEKCRIFILIMQNQYFFRRIPILTFRKKSVILGLYHLYFGAARLVNQQRKNPSVSALRSLF